MTQAPSTFRPMNRTMELLVRAKKRVAPNFRLEALPFYVPTKKWIFDRLREKEVTVHGFPFLLDPLELSIFRSYEPFETALLGAEIRPGMTIVDIGANIGYYTLLFSKLTGEMGRVYALEPEPRKLRAPPAESVPQRPDECGRAEPRCERSSRRIVPLPFDRKLRRPSGLWLRQRTAEDTDHDDPAR